MRSERGADDLTTAEPVALTEVPTIDFSPFFDGDARRRKAIAMDIAAACEDIGFFSITGHRVPAGLRAGVFEQSARFFALPLEDRQKVAASYDWYRGWIGTQPGGTLTRNSRLFEQFRMQKDMAADDPDVLSGNFFYKPNRWPENLDGFAETCNRYYDAMEALSRHLLQAFALGAGLPQDRFDDHFKKPLSQLSLMYNPPLPPSAERDVTNMVSHTDDTPFTILAQGEVGGLEVKRRDGQWIAVPPSDEALTINVGDMMMWWTNGRYLSNLHRVRNTSTRERYSIPFFLNPDHDVVVAPLPEFVSSDGAAKFPPVHVATHLSRFYSSFKKPHVD
jgi:isopenicillin N synthase-like dioxygenase